MCNAASFVLTKDAVYWSKTSNSHEEIIREFNLPDGHNSEVACFRAPLILRVEITPNDDDYSTDPATWIYHVDQDALPEWFDGTEEQRARECLPEWQRYHCCTQEGKELVGGYRVSQQSGNDSTQTAGDDSTQTAGDDSTQTAGYRSTQTAGDDSTQTAGDDSTQTAGYRSTQTAGYRSTQTAGYRSTQTAGYRSTQTAGNDSIQTAGNDSTQTAGNDSTQTAGNRSTQTAGDDSTQTAGNRSTQTAGNGSTQTAGVGTVQIVRWYSNGWRVATRVITEAEAGKPYKVVGGVWTPLD